MKTLAAILEGSTPDRATGFKGLTKLDPVLFLEAVVDDCMVTGMAEWLESINPCSNGHGFEYT